MTNINLKTENEILESQELRNELLSRTEVLDKVKTLFLLPKLEMMTMAKVAEYYEVETKAVEKCFARNRVEIEEDGARKYTLAEVTNRFRQNVGIKNMRGSREFDLGDGVTFRMPNVGMIMFPKRAILRIGMLLRDSEIAKEVRTQLLNTFEKATETQRTGDADKEKELVLDLLNAFQKQDTTAMLTSAQTLYQFQRRHITALETENEEIKTDNKMLAGEILKWSDRDQVNRVVRYLSNALDIKWQFVYAVLYKELLYKHGINLSSRLTKSKKKSATKLDMVKDSEWPALQSSLAAICESYGFSPEKVYQKALKYQAQ